MRTLFCLVMTYAFSSKAPICLPFVPDHPARFGFVQFGVKDHVSHHDKWRGGKDKKAGPEDEQRRDLQRANRQTDKLERPDARKTGCPKDRMPESVVAERGLS